MKAWTRRDLTIITDGEREIVIACDSCGAIGNKKGDVLKIEPFIPGKLTARVALMEVMCTGAVPVTISNAVSNEMNPTGEEIIQGIKNEIQLAELEDVVLTGSTEENFKTDMTAIGITVVGLGTNLRFDKARPQDKIILFGLPKLGGEVDLQSVGFYKEIKILLQYPSVREIVPVGSKGIQYEADTLAELNQLRFVSAGTDVDLKKSAGPATCLIALCDRETSVNILNRFPDAIEVGELQI